MLSREKVISVFNNLPEGFSIDQAIDALILLDKIDNGLAQSEANNVIPDEELDQGITRMVKINWTPQAKNDLISIAEYIAQDSIKYAKL